MFCRFVGNKSLDRHVIWSVDLRFVWEAIIWVPVESLCLLSWLSLISLLSLFCSGSLPPHRVQKALWHVCLGGGNQFRLDLVPFPCHSIAKDIFDFHALLQAAGAYHPYVRSINLVQL